MVRNSACFPSSTSARSFIRVQIKMDDLDGAPQQTTTTATRGMATVALRGPVGL